LEQVSLVIPVEPIADISVQALNEIIKLVVTLVFVKCDGLVDQIVCISPEALRPAVRVQSILTLIECHGQDILTLAKVLGGGTPYLQMFSLFTH